MRKFSLPRILSLLVLASVAACNFQKPANLLPGSPTTQHTIAGEVGAASPPAAVPTDSIDPEPPPAGLIDILYMGVDSGRWSYEEGLISSLQLLAGEKKFGDISSERPTSQEGTGIIREAQYYLQTGNDPQAKSEIERLINAIAPSPDRLLDYAQPVTAQNMRAPGHAQRVLAEQDCINLWKEGFPSKPGIPEVQCLDYKQITVGPSKVQVLFPVSTIVPNFNLGYADAALAAVKDGLQTYAKLSVPTKATQLKDVQIVFTLLKSEKPNTLAMVPSVGGAQTCQILIYPLAIVDDQDEVVLGASDFEHFKQTVAHETFHCFQVWNFPAISDGLWATHDWWGEGSAVYFGNFVYPTVNDEWEWLGAWRVKSSVTSILHLSYENFGFFQYFANKFGNDAILKLLDSLPADNDLQAQTKALSDYPDMDLTFKSYARAFMDGKIADTSGELLDTLPPYILQEYQHQIAGPDILNLVAAPFIISRYMLTFKPGHLYALNLKPSGLTGSSSTRPHDAPGAWGDFPQQIVASCQPATYYALLTTTAPAASDLFNIETTISIKDNVICDECLIGMWDLDLPGFENYLSAPFAGAGDDFFKIDTMGGLWQLEFSEQATVLGTYDFFVGYEINQAGADALVKILTEVLLDVTGDGSAQYLADGVGHITFYPIQNNFNLEQTILVNGQEIPGGENLMDGFPLSSGITGSAQYSCDDDTDVLWLAYDLGNGDLTEPIKYNRH